MDTRESGPALAAQVAGGLTHAGVSAQFAGVITTPGVAYLARTRAYIAGVMISASHNPYHDNGIKVINHAGYKLADAIEEELEARIFAWLDSGAEAKPQNLVVDRNLDHIYAEFLASTIQGTLPFRLVIDCANGSATAVAPQLFKDLGATIDLIGNSPDGRNINLNCGSLHLVSLRERVLATGVQISASPSTEMQTGRCS